MSSGMFDIEPKRKTRLAELEGLWEPQYLDEDPIEDEKHNRYTRQCLVGNWYEERLQRLVFPGAVIPCIVGRTYCVDHPSVYKHDFGFDATADGIVKMKKRYEITTMEGYNNCENDRYSKNIRNTDGPTFYNNFTSSTDLEYRVKPEMDRKNPFHILKRRPKIDLMNSIGNATVTGLREWKAWELKEENKMWPTLYSTYQLEFPPPPKGDDGPPEEEPPKPPPPPPADDGDDNAIKPCEEVWL